MRPAAGALLAVLFAAGTARADDEEAPHFLARRARGYVACAGARALARSCRCVCV